MAKKKSRHAKRLDTLAAQTTRKKQAVLAALIKYPVVQTAISEAGVGRSTFYGWCKTDREFFAFAKKTQDEGNRFVSDMAKSQIIRHIQDGYFPACVYWLKHHDPEFAERFTHKHRHEFEVPRELTKDEIEKVKNSLYNIGLREIVRLNKSDIREGDEETATAGHGDTTDSETDKVPVVPPTKKKSDDVPLPAPGKKKGRLLRDLLIEERRKELEAEAEKKAKENGELPT